MKKVRCLVCSEHFNDIACVDYQRQKVAKEIFEEIEKDLYDVGYTDISMDKEIYKRIKRKFLQGKVNEK